MHPLPFGSLGAASGHIFAVVGMEGAGDHGVMLEAGAHRCLLTMIPLHVPAKGGDLPQTYARYAKNLETRQLCVGGRRRERLVVPLYFYPAFGGGHGNYYGEQVLLGYDMRTALSTPCSSRRAALAAGDWAPTNRGASEPSRNSERLSGPGSSSGALCSPVTCPATLGRAPGTGNPACGCYWARALQASSCPEVGRQEHALVAG